MAEKATTLATDSDSHKLVTENHVKCALENAAGPQAKLKSFDVVDFTAVGDNYSCFVTSVKVTYVEDDETKTTSFVVKLNPCRAMESMATFTARVFRKESEFYTLLLPKLNKILTDLSQPKLRLPECYHASLESKKEIIIFEDMRPKAYKMFDRMKGLDGEHATLVVEELARLHAASVLLQEQIGAEKFTEKFECLEELFISNDDFPEQLTFKGWFKNFVLSGAKIAEKLKNYSQVSAFLTEIAPTSLDILIKQMGSKSPFKVVCHGDCWNNNLLFRLVKNSITKLTKYET